MSETERLLTTKEAAERLGLQPGTLENWRCLDKGPPYIRVGERSIRYPEQKLRAWADPAGWLISPAVVEEAIDRAAAEMLNAAVGIREQKGEPK